MTNIDCSAERLKHLIGNRMIEFISIGRRPVERPAKNSFSVSPLPVSNCGFA
jgi:hypothetical protein